MIGDAADQLYALDKRFVDPRRPPRTKKPTAEDAEERLIPYSEVLPLLSTHYASYDKKVSNQATRRSLKFTAGKMIEKYAP